jgi:hypothetical protein
MNRRDVFLMTMKNRMMEKDIKARLNDSVLTDGSEKWDEEVPDRLVPLFGDILVRADNLGTWHKSCDYLTSKHKDYCYCIVSDEADYGIGGPVVVDIRNQPTL